MFYGWWPLGFWWCMPGLKSWTSSPSHPRMEVLGCFRKFQMAVERKSPNMGYRSRRACASAASQGLVTVLEKGWLWTDAHPVSKGDNVAALFITFNEQRTWLRFVKPRVWAHFWHGIHGWAEPNCRVRCASATVTKIIFFFALLPIGDFWNWYCNPTTSRVLDDQISAKLRRRRTRIGAPGGAEPWLRDRRKTRAGHGRAVLRVISA